MAYKALIIEDQPAILAHEVQLMQELKEVSEILSAPNGEAGWRIIQKEKPDLILLDWDLGAGMAGIDVLKKARSHFQTQDIVIIMVTVFTNTSYIEEAIQSGATDYISKPIDKFELLMRCKSALQLYQDTRRIREERQNIWQAVEEQTTRTKRIKEKNEQLTAENKFKEKLLSIVLHDIKNPITGLYLFLELLFNNSEANIKEEVKGVSEGLLDSIKTLDKTVEKILNWSYSQAGRIYAHCNFFSIGEGIDEALSLCYTMLKNKELSIVLELHDKESKVYADKNMFDFVVRNLLSNAVKFSFRGNSIRVASCEVKDGFIEVYVQDKGVGIPKGMKKEIFKTKKTFLQEGTEGEKGTGLGLFLCREFVHKNNGTIQFESSDRGATFSFTVPTKAS